MLGDDVYSELLFSICANAQVLKFTVDTTRWALMYMMGMYAVIMEEITRRLPPGIIAKAFALMHGIIE